MPLQVGSSKPLIVGDALPHPEAPAAPPSVKSSQHVPKPRAIQKPRAISKVVTKTAGVDHYQPRKRGTL